MEVILDAIIYGDEQLFYLLNTRIHNSFFDLVLPILRNKYFWVPLYTFIIFFLFYNFNPRKALIYLLSLMLTLTISDQLSSNLIKNQVKRPRPCQQYKIMKEGRVLVRCGNGYSFTSSHATNHFAMAFFLSLSLGQWLPKIKMPLYIWAAVISFSQIYVGVHFPLDILMGTLLGSLIGILCALIFNTIQPNHFEI